MLGRIYGLDIEGIRAQMAVYEQESVNLRLKQAAISNGQEPNVGEIRDEDVIATMTSKTLPSKSVPKPCYEPDGSGFFTEDRESWEYREHHPSDDRGSRGGGRNGG